MKISDIINKINIYDVEVEFYSLEELYNRLSVQGNNTFICFSVMNDTQKLKYEKNFNEDFISKSASIQVPDISVDELLETLDCVRGNMYSNLKEIVRPYVNQDNNEGLLITIILFLHEVGHYQQLKRVEFNVKKYCDENLEEYQAQFDKVSLVNQKRNERLKNGNNCTYTFNENKQLDALDEEYRAIPKELEADMFAINNLENAIVIYNK